MKRGCSIFRKRRRPTPGFRIPPPYNPMQGEQANLRQDGTSPFCAMMQVAAEDTYNDYVVCRGFDPRILKFIDYAEGDENKPGISVAKPYGKRYIGTYSIGEIYPALLPTQGNTGFTEFRQVNYVPPSPVDVKWRVGQNPGVAVDGLDDGHPADLSTEVEILYDHNGKVVNWLMIDGGESLPTMMTIFQLLEDLDSGIGETATALTVLSNDPELTPGSGLTVYNTGKAKGYATCRGLALKIKTVDDEWQWWVIEVDQFALYYTCKLTTDTHGFSTGGSPTPGSRADQIVWTSTDTKALTPYPFSYIESQQVHNPFNFHGETGDILLIAHVEAGYTYDFGSGPVTCKNIILNVFPETAREFFVKLTADVSYGDLAPDITAKGWGPLGNNSGQIPSSVTANDRYYNAYLAKTDHTGIVTRDLLNEELVVRHMEHWATRVLCTFVDTWCDSRAYFNASPLRALNGLLPTTDPIGVRNIHELRGAKTGDFIAIYWSQSNGEWYPEKTVNYQIGIEFIIDGISTALLGPYSGLIIATGVIQTAPCEYECLIGTSVSVVDHSGCIFDKPEEELIGVWAWASTRIALSRAEGAGEGEMSPCHWAADDRCCTASEGGSGGSSGG